jgi:septal ring factor EnvC (AmiA/AmiB activator)
VLRNSSRLITATSAAALVAFMAGCASAPPPNEKLAIARTAVQRAEQAGAGERAPSELATARDKLDKATQAANDDKKELAARWADQANIDAQLAEATAQADRSHKAAAELDASLKALRQESERATPPTTNQ